jgi:YHS domain-containing protein
MLRLILLIILIAFIARAFWRVMDGVMDGMRHGRTAGPRPGAPIRSVQMERDPVCGTFVVPERAITLTRGQQTVYFCSERCRDDYRADRSGRSEQVKGA